MLLHGDHGIFCAMADVVTHIAVGLFGTDVMALLRNNRITPDATVTHTHRGGHRDRRTFIDASEVC